MHLTDWLYLDGGGSIESGAIGWLPLTVFFPLPCYICCIVQGRWHAARGRGRRGLVGPAGQHGLDQLSSDGTGQGCHQSVDPSIPSFNRARLCGLGMAASCRGG